MVDFSQLGRRLTAVLAAAAGFFSVAAAAAPFGGAFGGNEKPAVTAEIVADRTAGTPKAVYKVGVLLKHAPGWHTYWKFPGDSGYSTSVTWQLPRRWEMTPLDWPLPKRITTGPVTSFVYQGDVLLPFKLDIPWGTPYGTSGTIRAKVEWLACKEQCVPGETEVKFTVPVKVASDPSPAAPLFDLTSRNTPEVVEQTDIKAVIEDNRIRIDFPRLAGRIDRRVEFIPTDGRQIDFKGPERIERAHGVTSLYLTSHKDLAANPESLTGIIVADGGPLERGWAIETTLPLEKGTVAPLQDAAAPAASAKESRIELQTESSAPAVSLTVKAAVIFAFLGGLILNLMPCVFPVLSLKILQLVDTSRRRGSLTVHGFAFTGGLLATMLVLSGILLVLRHVGSTVGWGFQLQSPGVVAILALLFTALSLNLFGLFEFTAATHLADSRAAKSLPTTGPAGSFWTGVLAVVVASPCTAPFMGAALGYAVTQEAWIAVPVFAALGLGMAFPWLLLTLVPVWTKWLPKPGMWMVRFKAVMAIPMLGAVLWLLWVLSRQVSVYGLLTVLLATGAFAAFLWSVGREQYGRGASAVLKWLAGGVALSCVLLIGIGLFDKTSQPAADNADWQPWSETAVSDAVNLGHPVVVDFTAAWCVTCQYNKTTVLRTDASDETLKRLNYRRFVADWTSRDETITKALNKFGRTGVPLYILYNQHGEMTVLPELLTQSDFTAALEKNAAE